MTTAPHLALTRWGPGQLCAFSGLDGPTCFVRGLVARTTDAAGLRFRHPGATTLTFGDGKHTGGSFGVDWFAVDTGTGTVRGAFLDTHHLLLSGPVTVELAGTDRRILCVQRDDRTLVASLGHLDESLLAGDLDAAIAARQAWVNGIDGHWTPPQRWRRLATKCLQQMKGMVYAPEGQLSHRSTTPDRWPHRAVWLWDSAFHAIGYRHLDPHLAQDALDAVFDGQAADGQIAIAADPFATQIQRTQPPVLAWSVAKVHAISGDDEWLHRCLPRLSAYLGWIAKHRRLGEVFGWVEDGNEGWSVCDESGMDNSPRFSGTGVLRAIDLCCFMARDYQAMAELTAGLGLDAATWRDRADAIIAHIEADFWNDELGIYTDLVDADGSSTGIEAVTGFLPLILGSPSDERVEQLTAAVNDPGRFGSSLPLPTLSRRHPDLYDKDMWKGPVWLNTNWLVAEGFARCSRSDVADSIRERSLDVMQQWQDELGCIFEFYDDDNQIAPPVMPRKGKNAPGDHPYHQVMHDFGWSATLAVDWLSQTYG